jgi:hypothetical protein
MSNLFLRQLIAPASAAALVLLIGATPAAARPDAGTPVTSTASATASTSANSGRCALERIGTQLVRCDNLTGNGVAAPGWVKARSSSAAATSTTAATASTTTDLDMLIKFRRHGI